MRYAMTLGRGDDELGGPACAGGRHHGRGTLREPAGREGRQAGWGSSPSETCSRRWPPRCPPCEVSIPTRTSGRCIAVALDAWSRGERKADGTRQLPPRVPRPRTVESAGPRVGLMGRGASRSGDVLGLGKLPPPLLERLLRWRGAPDRRVVVGPGCGLDAAVVALGRRRLILKSDPVTFTARRIGWYAVQVNANDVAVMGGRPAWFQPTILVPPGTNVWWC